MRGLPFAKISPGGNATILLAAPDMAPRLRTLAAKEVLSPHHLGAEQAGFVDMDARSLEMAGGEFCVNATRAFAFLLALEGRLEAFSCDSPGKPARRRQGQVRVSGMPDAVAVSVTRTSKGWNAAARFDLPESPDCRREAPDVVVVSLPGITHILVESEEFPKDWERSSARLRREYALEECAAAGCVWWRRRGGVLDMDPVVWVRDPATLHYESACGSGALALALALRARGEAAERHTIMQPSGMPLETRLEERGNGLAAHVDGPVRLLARGRVFLECVPGETGGAES